MNPIRRKILLVGFKLFDLLNMSLCFAFAAIEASNNIFIRSVTQIIWMGDAIRNIIFFLFSLIIWHIVFSYCTLYQSKRLCTQWKEVRNTVKATCIGSMLVFIGGVFFSIHFINPIFLAIFWFMSTIITLLSRIVLRYALRQIRIRGRNLRHMLIIGTNSRALKFAEKINRTPELGYHILGFVDNVWPGMTNLQKTGAIVVCDLNNFRDFIRDQVVDEVVLALPIKTFYNRASEIVYICQEQGIIVRYLSNIFNVKLARSRNEYFEGYPMTMLFNGTTDGWPMLIKRMMDITISLTLLLLFLPLALVIAIAIKISSSGPVFFVQERVGLNKRKFRLYKFRTMVRHAEMIQAKMERYNEVSGPVFKIKDDPRITRIGKFLRKSSIDELPQLINVLKGEMSLVGPRPLPVRDYTGFSVDWHRRRFSVRPGITGLWQVNGRSAVAFEKWMELDMKYIDRWSLYLDLMILFKTIPAVIRGYGAS